MTNTSEIISSIVAVGFFTVYSIFPLYSTFYIVKNFEKIKNEDQVIFKRFGSLFDEFRNDSLASLLFYPLFMIRRFLTSIAILHF